MPISNERSNKRTQNSPSRRKGIPARLPAVLLVWVFVFLAGPVQVEVLAQGQVLNGIDVLEGDGFRPLRGRRVGLITNATGVSRDGRRSLDILAAAPGVELVAAFSPEHGLTARLEQNNIASGRDAGTGVPVFSLYGETRRPTPEMLRGIDTLVFDIQDVGVRFYTYITTLGYAMEAAARAKIRFVVLDRPNPISGVQVEGPLLDPEARSFIGYFSMPVRHGMTVGELARMFNAEQRLGATLEVIAMKGWKRGDWFDSTGLGWINPSPNIRNLSQATLYPGVGLLEFSNISVGRGTDSPFELVGAPWIQATELAAFLKRRKLPGVRFLPVRFTPSGSVFAGEACQGVRILVTDRNSLGVVAMGVEIASALHALYPGQFRLEDIARSLGNRATLDRLRNGGDPRLISKEWADENADFLLMRNKYLLY